MATIESVLRDVQTLTIDEQRLLLKALQPASGADELQRVRERIARTTAPTPEELATIRAMIDRTGAEIAAAWKSNKSALEAVQEQRRDL